MALTPCFPSASTLARYPRSADAPAVGATNAAVLGSSDLSVSLRGASICSHTRVATGDVVAMSSLGL